MDKTSKNSAATGRFKEKGTPATDETTVIANLHWLDQRHHWRPARVRASVFWGQRAGNHLRRSGPVAFIS